MQPLFKFAYRIGVAITIALPILSVQAEPIVGPSDMSFYSPPMNDGGNHGDLIWYRAATVELGDEAPAFIAWNLLYHSTDAVGQPNYVTGTMLVPSEGWAGLGRVVGQWLVTRLEPMVWLRAVLLPFKCPKEKITKILIFRRP